MRATITSLPSPQELKAQLPLSPSAQTFIHQSRKAAQDIIHKRDHRKALIIGPCSIHDRKSALEYAAHFHALSQEVKQTCLMVMRVYVEKPRTSTGWKGLLYDPHLNASHDIRTGLIWTRELLIALAEMQVPCATEFVDPLAALYFNDLISWGFIGARTSSSQPHRQFASAMDMPIGFKNATDGDLNGAIHGVLSVKEPHAFLHIDGEGKLCAMQSKGNPHAHVVLRGSYDFTNYDHLSVTKASDLLQSYRLATRLMIDCSHGNSLKQHDKQQTVFLSVLEQMEKGDLRIFGLMLESHLESGNQPLPLDLSQLKYAVSITDPCLDWKTTERLIYSAHHILLSSPISR